MLHLPSGTYLHLDAGATRIVNLVSETGEDGAVEALVERFGLEPLRARADVTGVIAAIRGSGAAPASGRRPTGAGARAVLRSWGRLPWRAKAATARATVLVVIVEIALRTASLETVARRVGVPLLFDEDAASLPALDPSTLTEHERMRIWAVRWVLQAWLFDATCLRRALTWGWVLRGHHPRLCIGLVDEDGVLAHAWLVIGAATVDALEHAHGFLQIGTP